MGTMVGSGALRQRLAWLPVALFLALMLLALPVDAAWAYDAPWLLVTLNAVFLTALPLTVACLAALAYRDAGHSTVLALGAGSLALAGSGLLPGILDYVTGAPGVVAVHNIAAALAGACHLGAVLAGLMVLPYRPRAARGTRIAVVYGAVLGCLAALCALVLTSAMPAFVLGGSFTPLRRAVLGTAVVLFWTCTLFWAVTWTNVRTAFARCYWLGLALYALGLSGVLVQHTFGSPVGWLGRGAQYLAGVYLAAAVMRARREDGLAVALTHATLPYRPMVESAADPIIAVDRNGAILYWNAAARRRFGYEAAEVLGAGLAERIAAQPGREALRAALRECRATGVPTQSEVSLVDRAGTWFPAEVALYLVGERAGWLTVCLVRDQTERHRSQEALRRSVALLTSQHELSPDGILAVDEHGDIISVNQRFLALWGIPPAAAGTGRSAPVLAAATALVPDPDGFQDRIRRIYAQRDQRFQEEIDLVDGRVLERVTAPITGPDGEYLGRVWFCRDISDRKRSELALRATAAELVQAQRIAGMGSWRLDVETALLYCSAGVFHIVGLPDRDGEPVTEREAGRIIHPFDRRAVRMAVDDCAHTGRGYDMVFRVVRPDGEVRWLHVRGVRVAGGGTARPHLGGTVRPHLVGTAQDITERHLAEEQIRLLNQELEDRVAQRTAALERSNRELEEFSYATAHDLRTPLRAMSGFSELLLRRYGGQLDERDRYYAERIHRAALTMGGLLDDLLELTSIARREVHAEQVDVSAMVTDVAAYLGAAHPERKVILNVEDGLTAHADPVLLRTALHSLLDNAWKFTAARPVAHVRFGAEHAEAGQLAFVLGDDGTGFDPAYADRLFQPFHRLHDATQYPGNGMGLAAVRTVVEHHGGRVWAEGKPGAGAAVHFTLAGQPCASGTAGRARHPDLPEGGAGSPGCAAASPGRPAASPGRPSAPQGASDQRAVDQVSPVQ